MKRPLVPMLALSLALGATAFAGESGPEFRGDLEARLARAELLAGLTPVQGPGLIVHLRNSPRAAPRDADRKALQVAVQDFNAILNELRSAGAEAVAIGGQNSEQLERVCTRTAAREVWDGLLINDMNLRPPYRILAIGEASRLRMELLRDGGVIRKAGLDVLQMVELQNAASLSLPPVRAAGEFRFARAGRGATVVAQAPAPEPRAAPEPPARPVFKAARADASPPGEPRIAGIVRRGVPSPPPAPTRVTQVLPEPELRIAPKPVVNPLPKPLVTAPPVRKPAGMTRIASSVFGGRGLAKFHTAGCRYGERIETGERVSFASTDEAVRKGRTPCAICAP